MPPKTPKIDEAQAFEYLIRYLFFEDEFAGLTDRDAAKTATRFKNTGSPLPDDYRQRQSRNIESLLPEDVPTKAQLLSIPPEDLTIRQSMIMSLQRGGLNVFNDTILQRDYPQALAVLKAAGIEHYPHKSRPKGVGTKVANPSPTSLIAWENIRLFKNKIKDNLGTHILNNKKKNIPTTFLIVDEIDGKNVKRQVPIRTVTGALPIVALNDPDILQTLKLGEIQYPRTLANAVRDIHHIWKDTLGKVVPSSISTKVKELGANIEKTITMQPRRTQKPTGWMGSARLIQGLQKVVSNMQSPLAGADAVDHNTYKIAGLFFGKHQERISNTLATVVYDPEKWGGNKAAFEEALKNKYHKLPPYFDITDPSQIHISQEAVGMKRYFPIPLGEGWGILLQDQARAVAAQGKHVKDGFFSLFGDVNTGNLADSYLNAGLRETFADFWSQVKFEEAKSKPQFTTKFFRKFLTAIFKEEAGFTSEQISQSLGHIDSKTVSKAFYEPGGDFIADTTILEERIQAQNQPINKMRNWLGSKVAQVLKLKTFKEVVDAFGISSPSLEANPVPLQHPDIYKGTGAASVTPPAAGQAALLEGMQSRASAPAEATDPLPVDKTGPGRQRIKEHRKILKELYPDLPAERLQFWMEQINGRDGLLRDILEYDPNILVPEGDILDFQRLDNNYSPDYDYSADLDEAWNNVQNDEAALRKRGSGRVDTAKDKAKAQAKSQIKPEDFATPDELKELGFKEGESVTEWRERTKDLMARLQQRAATGRAAGIPKAGIVGVGIGLGAALYSRDLASEEFEKRAKMHAGEPPSHVYGGLSTPGQVEHLFGEAMIQKGAMAMPPDEAAFHEEELGLGNVAKITAGIPTTRDWQGGLAPYDTEALEKREASKIAKFPKLSFDPAAQMKISREKRGAFAKRRGEEQLKEAFLDELEKEEGIVF